MPTLHEIFEAQAELRPADVAVAQGSQTITYGELDARANRLARSLRARGVRRGATIALLLPRSIDAYTAILAILKAGAAYVPIDPGYPAERAAWIAADAGACAMVTLAGLAPNLGAFAGAVIRVDAEEKSIAAKSAEALPPDEDAAQDDDLCYLIYTSGSTGRPKGVMVEHRNAVHLVEAERAIFGVRPHDRVYQGASLCFDLSVEEMWLAFAAGATLAAATPEMCCAGPDLPKHLEERGVTVLSCVPTLLAMMDDAELPALRLLIVGGEACSAQLAARWARPWRRMVNTYGPTETTVIATYADVSPEQAVTIGRAVPGYEIRVLNEHLEPVARGEAGEICIGGAGVARGYRGLPDQTRERFVEIQGERFYRSGDVGRFDTDGSLEFIGRADGQVKLRGLRIELGEIEAALLRDESVRAAVCVMREQLVACIVPRNGGFDESGLRAGLRRWLPVWMVPSVFETVSELPLLASGKLDRAALAAPRVRPAAPKTTPMDPIERKLTEVWAALFGAAAVSVDDDFFLDLGGHSLLAARMVSEMRRDERFATVTMRDVYSHPTVARLASVLRERAPREEPAAAARTLKQSSNFAAGAIQTASLYFVFAFRALQWIAPWLVFFSLLEHHSAMESAVWALVAAVAVLPAMVLIAVCAKWLVLGRVRPGRYPLWGSYYVRWWFVQTLVRSVPLTRLGGTPLLPFVYRLFGARIGKNVHIATDLLGAFDVTSIGDGASVDEGASLLGYTVENGELAIAPVSAGRDCLVGTRSVLSPGAVMEDGARLEDLSLVRGDVRIPAGETWAGSPAQKVGAPKQAERTGRGCRPAVVALYAALAVLFPFLELAAFLPGVDLLWHFTLWQPMFYLAAPAAGLGFIVCVTAEVVLLKWLLIGRARAGRYRVHGSFYIRNWIVEQLLAFSVDVAGPLHSTVFLKPWYRALGAKLGRFVEVSTASTTTPDLLDIEDDCTVADEVSLGAARVERGWLTLAPTRLGRRTFVGNGAVIPAGTSMSAGSLVGVMTVAPSGEEQTGRKGGAWLGSPPMLLTRRQPCTGFSEQTTFRPTRKLQFARGCWEILRIVSPGAGFIVATVGVLDTALALWNRLGAAATFALLPALFAAFCAAVALAVVPAKWIVIGRFRPFATPLWSAYLWRIEFVNALFEFMAIPIGLETLQGTPMLAWYLRLLGCRIGRGVYIDTAGFIESDLVEVGDRAILNRDCVLQTHLYEDRVMKGSKLRIGADCEIGTNSIVLYDAEMKPGARLGALSLVMKGETVPAGRVWVGAPLKAVSYRLSAVS